MADLPTEQGTRPSSLADAATRPMRDSWWRRSLWFLDRSTVIVLAVLVASRIAIFAAGVRFDTQWVPTAWQIADTELLRTRLIETVWFGHSQPPMLNATIGLVLRFSPLSLASSFFVLYSVLAAVLAVVLVDLLRRFGTSRITQVIVACAVIVSPPVMLYGNWLSYEFPTVVGIAVAVDLLAAYVARPRVLSLAALMSVTVACILTRSLLHPLLFVLVAVMALVARRPVARRRAVIFAVVIPGLILSVFVVRNAVLWGQPSLSSWSGMNMAHAVLPGTSLYDRAEKVADGSLSPLAIRRTFQNYDAYAGALPPCTVAHSDIAEVARPTKSNGTTNFDYECFLRVNNRYQRDALATIAMFPANYARQELFAAYLFFGPSDRYDALRANQVHIKPLSALYERLGLVVNIRPVVTSDPLFGKGLGDQGKPRFTLPVSLLAIVTTFIAVLAAFVAGFRWFRRGPTAIRVAVAAIGGLILFTFLFGNAFEVGENQRFRFLIEPLVWVVIGLLADRTIRRRWSGQRSLVP
ncbi:MAG: hypothetical protein WCK41_06875 [Actinomycetes bacterium]